MEFITSNLMSSQIPFIYQTTIYLSNYPLSTKLQFIYPTTLSYQTTIYLSNYPLSTKLQFIYPTTLYLPNYHLSSQLLCIYQSTMYLSNCPLSTKLWSDLRSCQNDAPQILLSVNIIVISNPVLYLGPVALLNQQSSLNFLKMC
jgi:hypothetical protein